MEQGLESSMRCASVSRIFTPFTKIVQKFQDLEEERIDFMKSSLWSFANIASTVCVSDDAVRDALAMSAAKLTSFS